MNKITINYGDKKYDSIMAATLEHLKNNVIEGVKSAQAAGIKCEIPDVIEIDMPIDSNGLPCSNALCAVGRFKTTIST